MNVKEQTIICDLIDVVSEDALDDDVNDFGNEKQFFRTTYDPNTDHFRASVYIEKANHTQFNSDWGRLDLSVPRGLFLNKKKIMKPEEQREVAKLFMTAFFERIFNKDRTFEDVFRNHYFVKDYLPDTNIVTKYNPASYRVIESFEDDFSYEKAEGFDELEITTPKHRKGSNRMRDALSLTWSGVGSLPIDVSDKNISEAKEFVITMANTDDQGNQSPEVSVEFLMRNGEKEIIDVTKSMPFPPVIKTKFTHYGLFDTFFRGDRYANDWEPVFQTFYIPVEKVENVAEMIIHVEAEKGQIMIQEVGVY